MVLRCLHRVMTDLKYLHLVVLGGHQATILLIKDYRVRRAENVYFADLVFHFTLGIAPQKCDSIMFEFG